VWRRVIDVASQAAPSLATVLVLGESGTGKELLARFIHERSSRAKGPFVAVNCAAIPNHPRERAIRSRAWGVHGRHPLAKGRTVREGLFRDALPRRDFGELSPAVQVKLLRVLQEGEYEPLGGNTVRADVRIVAATNRDLLAEVSAGRFREDLFLPAHVIAVTAPPLRARREDIPLLVDHFLGLYCAKNGSAAQADSWPPWSACSTMAGRGNVRELET